MIHGPGVGRMYNMVMSARVEELHSSAKSHAQIVSIQFKLEDFRDQLRDGTRQELEEWYELYYNKKFDNPNSKKKRPE